MVRDARPDDTDTVVALLNEAFPEKPRFTRDDLTAPRKSGGVFLVAVADDRDDQIVGCVELDPDGGLNWLAVSKNFRRRGYAEALIREAEKRAKLAGATIMTLMPLDPAAKRFFVKLGYTDRLGTGDFLEKSLSPPRRRQ